MSEKTVTLGLVEPPLRDQLAGMAKGETLHNLDRLNSAINLLLMHGFLKDSEAKRCRERLMKAIQRIVTP